MALGAGVELRTLGEVLNAPWLHDAERWEMVENAVTIIAEHYGLNRASVWLAAHELENSWEEQTGEPAFGTLLEHPWGFTTLGIRVAGKLLGEAETAIRPMLHLTYH